MLENRYYTEKSLLAGVDLSKDVLTGNQFLELEQVPISFVYIEALPEGLIGDEI